MGNQGSKGSVNNSGINTAVNFINSSGYTTSHPEKSKVVAPSSTRKNSKTQMSGKHSLGATEAIKYCYRELFSNGNKPLPSKNKENSSPSPS